MSTQDQKKTGKKRTAGQTGGKKNVRSSEVRRSSGQSTSRKRKRSREAQKRRQIGLLITGIAAGLLVCLLGFSVYKLVSIFSVYHSADKEYEELEQYILEDPIPPSQIADSNTNLPASGSEGEGEGEDASSAAPLVPMTRIDLDALQEINPEAVGWIQIPDTVISYPLLHTSDNSYYLTHTFQKEKNRTGSIFIECSNKNDLTDLHTIIYGHNMRSGAMFADLKNYLKKDFWQEHPYVYIDLEDGAHCYEIFSCHEAAVTDVCYTVGYQADDIYADFLNALQTSSLFDTGVSVSTEDMVVTLSTCTNDGKNRIVVHAKKIY